ncbi:MAG: LCP family protein, partial [Patescibacteria group bacterium]
TSLVHSLPGVKNELKGEAEDRINIAVLGMRGENVEGGGLLADTIIVVSIKPKENKLSMISVPRDLFVTVPGTSDKQKINAVHHYGEQKSKGQGLEDMKTVLSEVLGIDVQYAASINFEGFKQFVNAIGGVEITLDKAFEEPMQFQEEKVCDPNVFTKPTGNYEYKYYTRQDGTKYIAKTYPLCLNPNTECGGDFKLPAGKQTLNGDQALCFVRSRKTSSDFERAKRQQLLIQNIKDQLLSAGTLTDFSKLSGILDSLGNNVRSDLALWEMSRFYELYSQMNNPSIAQRVLENSEEGLLYNPTDSDPAVGYILLPIGNNYDRIHAMAKDIFTLPAQSDIKPK